MEYVIKKWSLTAMLLLFGMNALFAQGVQFSASVSSTQVGIQEPFRLKFSIENASRVSDFIPPAFSGFQVVSRQQMQSTNIVNGKMSQSISFIFILEATAEGRFTIAGASARVDGNKLRSNPITITVEKSAGSPSGGNNQNVQPVAPNPFGFQPPQAQPPSPQSQSQPGILRNGEKAMDKIKKNVFVKVDVDKTNVYVGQQITATYKLYTRLPTSSQVTKVPSFTGFSAHDLKLSNPPRATMERIDGAPFKVFTIRKTMLFPLQSGALELDPVEVDNTVRLYQIQRKNRGRDPLNDIMNDPFFKDPFNSDPFNDPFFQDAFGGSNVTYHDYDYHITSKPVKIHVKPLPEAGKPADFSGAVGDFKINASLDKNKLSTDDAATLTVTVSGHGNITLVDAPKVDFPSDLESYDPKVSDKISGGNPFGGSRTFTYVIMPNAAGNFTIPPVKFAYFDPDDAKYITIETTSFALDITPGKNQKNNSANYAASDNALQPIRTGTMTWSKAGALWFGSWWYWLLLMIPVLILIALLAFKKRKKELQSNQTLLKNKRANRIALKRLTLANRFLQQNDHKAFYGEVSQAVWGYLCDKLNIPFAELSKQKAQEKLLEKQINGHTPERLFGLLDHCEMALYAGTEGHAQMKETYQNALSVITDLEQQLKGNHREPGRTAEKN
ncbi:MAG TPA: BatD family protein [Chitinophagaceae bacterium]|nr:BatD family protein [Chitinophagaceae bacterium]